MLEDRHGKSIDRLLADPTTREEFDAAAKADLNCALLRGPLACGVGSLITGYYCNGDWLVFRDIWNSNKPPSSKSVSIK